MFTFVFCFFDIRLATINSKFSSYERVELRPGEIDEIEKRKCSKSLCFSSVTFIRPVVLLGSLADVARDRLLDEFADQFELPGEKQTKNKLNENLHHHFSLDVHIENSGKQQKEMIKLKSLDNIIRKVTKNRFVLFIEKRF